VKIALAQINPKIGDLKHNFNLIVANIKSAREAGAKILFLPELALLGYPPKDLLLKHGLLERQQYYLNELLLYTKDNDFAIVVGGISENKRYGKKLHNSLYCLEGGEIKLIASKTLLPNYDVFDETRYFEPAHGVEVYEYGGVKFGLSICEDIWIEAYPSMYSKDPVRDLLAAGADVIINASASPYAVGKPAMREKLLGGIAKRHAVPIVYVNQIGANDELVFDGNSMVFDAQAQLRYKMGEFIEQCLIIDTDELFTPRSASDMSRIAKEQQESSETEQIRKALVLGLRDYAAKTGFGQVLLGISGGIDSAVVASLAVEAMGAENVYLVMMPSEFTSKDSLEDAQALAKNLGIGKDNYRVVPIKKLHQEMRSLLPDLSDIADENIQPRLRAALLMAMANSLDAIVLSTGNKSEIAVGYCTLYGDTCGALSLIGDLLKNQVYDLAALINSSKREIIPQRIIKREPTAELRHDQKDSDSLPTYDILDEVVYLYVQEMKTISEILEQTKLDKAQVTRILNMIDAAEHKRYQLPPVIKVAGKTFGAGRRMPIAHGYVLT